MRDSTTARGYGTRHQNERRRWQKIIDQQGSVPCTRPECDHLIHRGEPWDLGHLPDRSGWAGPQCVHGNRSDGARNSHAKIISRDW